MKTCFLSIDVERDNFGNENTYQGVENLDNILNIFKKHGIKATLFVTGEVLERYHNLVKKWAEDYEIGCHNYCHDNLDKLDLTERERQLKRFSRVYEEVLGNSPKGFRAPRNIIDNKQFGILERYGFVYDSSVLPRYPWPVRRYEGYRGRAPILPYYPSKNNYRKKGDIRILEIPESPISFGIPIINVPLAATWLRKWGVWVFKKIFLLKKPKFISFSMHSWDGIEFKGEEIAEKFF